MVVTDMGIDRGVEFGSPEVQLQSFMNAWVGRYMEGRSKESVLGQEMADELSRIIPAVTSEESVVRVFRSIEGMGKKMVDRWRGVMAEVAAQEMMIDWWGQGSVMRAKNLDRDGVDMVALVNPPEGANYDLRLIGLQVKTNDNSFEFEVLDSGLNAHLVSEHEDRDVVINPMKMANSCCDFVREAIAKDWGCAVEEVFFNDRSRQDEGDGIFRIKDGDGEYVVKVDTAYMGIPIEKSAGRKMGDAWFSIKTGKRFGGYEREGGEVVDLAKNEVFDKLGLRR